MSMISFCCHRLSSPEADAVMEFGAEDVYYQHLWKLGVGSRFGQKKSNSDTGLIKPWSTQWGSGANSAHQRVLHCLNYSWTLIPSPHSVNDLAALGRAWPQARWLSAAKTDFQRANSWAVSWPQFLQLDRESCLRGRSGVEAHLCAHHTCHLDQFSTLPIY